MKVNERDFKRGVEEVDLGTVHVTPEDYGRLAIRRQGDQYEIYDVDDGSVLVSDEDLEPIVEKGNQLTPMTFEYDEDHIPKA